MESCESGTGYYIGHCRSRRTAVSDISIITISSKAFTSILTLDVHFLTLQVCFIQRRSVFPISPPILCPLVGQDFSPQTFSTPTTSSVPKICSGMPRHPLFLVLNARYQPLSMRHAAATLSANLIGSPSIIREEPPCCRLSISISTSDCCQARNCFYPNLQLPNQSLVSLIHDIFQIGLLLTHFKTSR